MGGVNERSWSWWIKAEVVLLVLGVVVFLAILLGTGDFPFSAAPEAPGAGEEDSSVPPLPPGEGGEPGSGEDGDGVADSEIDAAGAVLPLSVVVLDGRTGEPVPGAALRIAGVRLAREGADHGRPRSPFRRGELASLAVELGLPAGYVGSPFETNVVEGTPGFRTDSLRAELVIWPEAPVTVRTRDVEGRPVPGALIHGVWIGGREVAVSVLDLSPTPELHVEGIPWIPGERVRVIVTAGEVERIRGVAEGVLDRDSGLELEVVVREDEVETDNDLPFEESLGNSAIGIGGGRTGTEPAPPLKTATVRVRAVGVDGEPAPGIRVFLRNDYDHDVERTDAEGVAVFRSVRPGPARVRVRGAGYLFPEETFLDVAANGVAELDVREEEGRDVLVRVLDAAGNPVCGARLTFSVYLALPWLPVEDGVQRLNVHTDRDGWARLPGFPRGRIEIEAHYGSRKEKVAVESESSVTIRLD